MLTCNLFQGWILNSASFFTLIIPADGFFRSFSSKVVRMQDVWIGDSHNNMCFSGIWKEWGKNCISRSLTDKFVIRRPKDPCEVRNLEMPLACAAMCRGHALTCALTWAGKPEVDSESQLITTFSNRWWALGLGKTSVPEREVGASLGSESLQAWSGTGYHAPHCLWVRVGVTGRITCWWVAEGKIPLFCPIRQQSPDQQGEAAILKVSQTCC